MQAHKQLQQASIIAQQFLSLLVHVKHTPFWVAVQVQSQLQRLHWQTTMPLAVQQKPSLPPERVLQISCKVAALSAHSQVQVTFTPPLHFSTFTEHRGRSMTLGLFHVWQFLLVSIVVAHDIATFLTG
jgi:hypothetical protein